MAKETKVKNTKQLELFREIETNAVSIDDSALRLGVSTATIRNWLKTGYLESGKIGGITADSLERFQDEIAGREKLTQRANKSFKDSHNHESLAATFIAQARSKSQALSSLGEEYESSLSDSYRNKEGIYYTPHFVVQSLFTAPLLDLNRSTFCDPCCGSGNFIIRALALGFKPENIYGFDVDPVAVEITKARVRESCGHESSNIQEADFLTLCTRSSHPRFNVIYTNPPWGKKLPKDQKRFLAARLGAGSSTDTSSLFFFACLESLEDHGTLGLLLPESFFNIATFESARLKALRLSIKRLIDFGKPFKGLVTKAQAMVLTKNNTRPSDTITCESNGNSVLRSPTSFSRNPKSTLNLHCDQESADTLEYLFSIPHITLADRATWGLGIVTGNNNKFIRPAKIDGHIPVFKGSDILPGKISQPSCYIPSDLSLYQQVAPRELYEAEEKLIYKFISSRLCFFHDTNQRYVLNSANMLIPRDDFPVSNKVLCELLNSSFMNWIFSCIFNSAKILRSDLEALPIHDQFLKGASDFCENSYLEKLKITRTTDGTYRIKK